MSSARGWATSSTVTFQTSELEQSVAGHGYHRAEHAPHCTDTHHNAVIVEKIGAGKRDGWSNWFNRRTMAPAFLDAMTQSGTQSPISHTADQSAATHKYCGLEEASRRTDTYNVVIFGQTGAGKSSLVNLIARTQEAPTSPDAMGCTTVINVYEHDIATQNEIMKVQLFDTVGLDEDSNGTVPNKQAQMGLKTLLSTLMKKGGVHLLVYCVQGAKDAWALQRNYNLTYSKVKGRVPIVLVVTGLEDQEPEMEEWWRKNERSISDLGMDFAGHACITTLTINEDDTDEVRQRHEQSYHAVCNLIGQFCLQNETGVHRVPTIPPVRKEHKNIVLFGASGVGKSSVVNLMAGMKVAATSASMDRCTMHWQEHTIRFGGRSYKVFDTVGLEEPQLGINEYLDSIGNAYALVKELDKQGGIDLLVFCLRAGRMTGAIQSNYRLFHEFLCEKKVPIVLAITNLEREQRMENWWDQEHENLRKHEIHVAGHACITAADGLPPGAQTANYEESRLKIRELVQQFTTDKQQQAWVGGDGLIVSFMRKLRELLIKKKRVKNKDIVYRLKKRCGISEEVAKQLVDLINPV